MKEYPYYKAFFALAFLRQSIQEGKRTGDFKQAHYWALEFLERREAARKARHGLPCGNVYHGRFTEEEKKAYLGGKLRVSKPKDCNEDHYPFKRFGGTCEACQRTF